MTACSPIQVALIGYGLSGAVFHAPLIQATPGLSLACVVGGSAAASGFMVRSEDEVLADPTIELMVLATPTSAHHDGARRALLAGKHVVVEKPLATTAREADALVALAVERGLMLSVFHNRRWDADFLTLKAILERGVLGRLSRLECNWDRFRPQVRDRWRERAGPGAGVWYDLGAHMLDQMLQLFGLPEAISARMGMERPGASAHDWFDVQLTYASGLRCDLRSSSMVMTPPPRFVAHGADAAHVKTGLDPQEDQLRSGMLQPGAPGWGEDPRAGRLVHPNESLEMVPSLPGDYPAFYSAVRDAVRDGSPPPVTSQEAAIVVRLLELASIGAVEGRRIDLPPKEIS